MKVLVITNQHNGKVNNSVLHLLSAANKLNNKCDVLFLAKEDVDCSLLNNVACIENLLLLTNLTDDQMLSSNLAKSLVNVVTEYTHILMASDNFSKDLLPRIAGVLDATQVSDVVEILSENVFNKPMYAGNILATVQVDDKYKFLTIRTSSFAKIQAVESASFLKNNLVNQVVSNDKIEFVKEELVVNDKIDLSSAPVVVSGGVSLGSSDNFTQIILPLADKLNGAMGATRAAVEAGYISNDYQVGQTGKIVAPKLYLAIGVSGAVQHIAGMKDSQTVIAINTDPNAAIFEYADYGLVADLFDVVPQLNSKL